jgi:hypothetical protein
MESREEQRVRLMLSEVLRSVHREVARHADAVVGQAADEVREGMQRHLRQQRPSVCAAGSDVISAAPPASL